MENASKALIMAASVLLGVMIISVGVALFRTFADFSSDAAKKMEEKQISEWNNTYLKYLGQETVTEDENAKKIKTQPIKVTAHEIVSVINSAIANNIQYFGNDKKNWNQYINAISSSNDNYNYYYVNVRINNSENKAELWEDSKKLEFLKNNSQDSSNETKYFKCQDVKISKVTKRVYSISFEEY